jgi:Protein of unknown function (DUF429)
VSVGFGLDLAGFSNYRGTVLAAIQAEENKADVVLLAESPFSRRLGDGSFAERLEAETATLKRLLEIGPIAVDVPIDLQGLPLKHAVEAWELTKRPVDDSFDGLAPLASWLGACVARFAAILPSDLKEKELGTRLFETYPAASLRQKFGKSDPDVTQYKLADKKKAQIATDARQRLSRRLGIECNGPGLNHDELDAVVCALAAIATPDQLLPEREYCLRGSRVLPAGYRLLNKTNPFCLIKIYRKPFDKWIIENNRVP